MRTTVETERHQRDLSLRVGDVVEVRSESELLATLDENGELDSLPFMPEMLQFCGRRMTVEKVAHKLCDTISATGMRRMDRAVHLRAARCDGAAHGGCQTGCLLYWKEAWLKRVDGGAPDVFAPSIEPRITLPLLEAKTRKSGDGEEELYSCQATEILRAAPRCLPFKDVRQYVKDVRSGNAGPRAVAVAFSVGLFNRLQNIAMKVLPERLWFRRGLRWRFLEGKVLGRTPTEVLQLQPGELVRIKSREEILATLDKELKNRGMGFEEEMERYCGKVAKVLRRVDRCIDESSGRMLTMKSSCIVLEGVVCGGEFNANCPRAFIPFWREIWLERVHPQPDQTAR